ncbi:MucBP domain-containing protein [Lactococcus lactis]|uniref:MucBP domain-containing protein n=1 Tax=Lactococcus lactis TaxID=1358 RepID=UPI0024A7B489|nr:MucBP domain-containing protein [Lactococcus lactis]
MKKLVITLIALFSVLVFSQPIRADTEQIATINFGKGWGSAQAVITRTDGKYHLNLTAELNNERSGVEPIDVGASATFVIQKNNEPSKEVLSLPFDSLGKRSGDIDLDIDDNDDYIGWLTMNGAVVYSLYPTMDVVPISDASYTQKINVTASPIIVNYVDETGKIIHDSQKITGNYGDNYDATSSAYKLDLKGYTLDQSKLPNNATGKISSTEQTVTYVYKVSWGNVPWDFDESTGTVTFTGSGTLGEYTTSPWNREDDFHINWSAIKKIVFTNVVNAPESSKYLFSSYEKSARLKNLLSIEGLDKVNTSNVKSMFWMFTDASALTELKGIEHWDTKNVTDMNNMFGGMLNLLSLDISNFSTEKVTSMSIMFNLATKLERLTLGKNSILNSSVNLPYISNNRDYTGNWVLEGSEKTVNMGNSSQFTNTYDGSKPGTYMWEKKVKQLTFKKVPDTMSFEDSKIFNNTIESKRKDRDWKMIVEDTRVDKNPWRVTAKLVEPFKNSSGESAAGNILLFRKTNASDQWITESEETNVFDGTSTKGIDDYDVSWSQDSGPIIQVAPGTVKAGEYKGVIQWSLTDAPV